MDIKKLLERNALTFSIILTLFVTLLSFISLRGVVKTNIENSDKFGHFLAYFTLGIFWLYAFRKYKKQWPIAIVIILYGILIEVLQGVLTTYRQADFYDFIANTSGVFVAYLLSKKISFLQ